MERNMESIWRCYAEQYNSGEKNNNLPKVSSEIFLSWNRCLNMGVSPYQQKAKHLVSPQELQSLKKENDSLIRYSLPLMNQLYDALKEFELVLSITDANGIILSIIGNPSIQESIKKGNFIEGADWSEQSAGTNAIGTALVNQHPMLITSYEHFCRCSQGFSCCCAPIRNSDYQIIGSIDITGLDGVVNAHTLASAVAASQAIEYYFVMLRAEKNCCMANNYKTALIDSVSQGIIAVDSNGIIKHFNLLGKKYFGLPRVQNVIGKKLENILPAGNTSLLELVQNQTLVVAKEVTLRDQQGNSRRYSITSRPVVDDSGKIEDFMVLIDEEKRIKKIAQTMSGARASLTFDDIIGESNKLLQCVNLAKKAAASDSSILLLGESGTGKDVFAQAIHNASPRADGPFVSINCGAMPRELIVSELFGFVEGSFTGSRKGGGAGRFELSEGGTLFLDEIGEIPLDLQPVFLRVLETKKITRIGGREEIPVDVRIIAATNCDLREKVKKGLFRLDLFYRLNIMEIVIPPLRERKEDIPLLIQHFCKRIQSAESNTFSQSFIDALMQYDFPGNVRELQNIVDRYCNLGPNDLTLFELLTGESEIAGKKCPPQGIENSSLPGSKMDAYEKQIIIDCISRNHNNLSKAAGELGIARSTLYRKMKKYNITL